MNQTPMQKFSSLCSKAHILVDNDMPLGALHDFIMLVKGTIVDIMVKTYQQEQAQVEAQKKAEDPAPKAE